MAACGRRSVLVDSPEDRAGTARIETRRTPYIPHTGAIMNLKTLGDSLLKLGLPLLGAALPLPGGAGVGAALASFIGEPTGKPENILAALTSDANTIQKAREFELTNHKDLLQLTLAADTAQIQAINTTMQAEANNSTNEAWYQKAWRPFNGFVVGAGSFASVLASFWLMYQGIINHDATAINTVPALAATVAAILAVPGAAVGIAAWHRGVAQVEQIKSGNQSGD